MKYFGSNATSLAGHNIPGMTSLEAGCQNLQLDKYHKFAFYVITLEQIKIRTIYAPQNIISLKDIYENVGIFIGSKVMTSNANS